MGNKFYKIVIILLLAISFLSSCTDPSKDNSSLLQNALIKTDGGAWT